MMALARCIYDFLRKEEKLAFDYIRKHPHSKWLIALDAVLSVSLVFGGFVYASASSKNATSLALIRVGAIAMTPSEFVEHARTEGESDYWLGELPGFDISDDSSQKDFHVMSYVRKGAASADANWRKITIATYLTSNGAHGFSHFAIWAQPSTFVTASGLVVQYDKSTMTDEIVKINGTVNTVSIHYLSSQTLETLRKNSAALRLVL